LTRAATDAATRVLPSTLLNHSYRTYRFGPALGELEEIDVDVELLFAAALLHDTGLVVASGRDDVTLTSARVARDVADRLACPRRRRKPCRPPSPCTTALGSPLPRDRSRTCCRPVPALRWSGCAAGTFRVPCWLTAFDQ
jgi:hypothetical protein